MAQICREIQERIEERRRELRESCRNVSRTVTERICRFLPWPFNKLCDLVTKVITELVCTLIEVVVVIVSWVTRVVCEAIVVIEWILIRVFGFVEWLVNKIITFPEWLLCLGGVKLVTKKYRICPIVIADSAGNPVVPLHEIQRQIETAKSIYRNCGIEVIATPIKIVRDRTHLLHASSCGAGGYFSSDRVEYHNLSCCDNSIGLKCLRFPSGLIWPAHVLKAIWVQDISSGERGCYMTPDSFVLMTTTALPDTLAHEMGHACDLLHRDDMNNLMSTGGRTGTHLTNFQCCTIRSSRFVSSF